VCGDESDQGDHVVVTSLVVRFESGSFAVLILSRDGVILDGFWVGNWICLALCSQSRSALRCLVTASNSGRSSAFELSAVSHQNSYSTNSRLNGS
jgi:hypothetical protein